ncbi:MAG: DoxX family membrane protein [Myxococcales bacterium]
MTEETVGKPEATHDLVATDLVWKTLRIVFGVVPIVAGLDKFTNLLTDWTHYLAPAFARMIPFSPHTFMLIVGVIEIVAGIGVLFTPWTRVFAWIVGLWLICISLNLIAAGFFDIAVRDLVMSITSFCLARLTAADRVAARRGTMVEARTAP